MSITDQQPRPRGSAPVWLSFALGLALIFLLRENLRWLGSYPQSWTLDIAGWINIIMDWCVAGLSGPLRYISWLFEFFLDSARLLLAWAPWSVTMCLIAIMAHCAGGLRLACFTLISLIYFLVGGFWEQAMNTLSLVVVAVPLGVFLGAALGVLAYRSKRANAIVQPTLDLMQTIPAFAYLIPILLLFGFGAVVGLIASLIFAIPPMVRSTILGLNRVPPEVKEAGLICGCNRRQQLWWVELPAALPQMLIRVNQTTMAALSMVIIAAIIGGSDDIGWAVLSTMRKAQFGPSLLAGLVIVLMAMMIDRINYGFAQRATDMPDPERSWRERHAHLVAAALALVVLFPLAGVAAQLWTYPKALVIDVSAPISQAAEQFVVSFTATLEGPKRAALFYFLLPLKTGLTKTISPFSWGFEFTTTLRLAYSAVAAGLCLLACLKASVRMAGAIALFAVLICYGTTGIPWPAFISVVTFLAYRSGGTPVAALAFGAMVFILLNGLWGAPMVSAVLCGGAILIAFPLGAAIGVAASEVTWVSKVIRPINDTL